MFCVRFENSLFKKKKNLNTQTNYTRRYIINIRFTEKFFVHDIILYFVSGLRVR